MLEFYNKLAIRKYGIYITFDLEKCQPRPCMWKYHLSRHVMLSVWHVSKHHTHTRHKCVDPKFDT